MYMILMIGAIKYAKDERVKDSPISLHPSRVMMQF